MPTRLTTLHAHMRVIGLDNSNGRCIGPPRRARHDDSTRSTTRCLIPTSCRAPGRLFELTAGLLEPMAKPFRPSRNEASRASSPTSGASCSRERTARRQRAEWIFPKLPAESGTWISLASATGSWSKLPTWCSCRSSKRISCVQPATISDQPRRDRPR